LPAPVFEDRLTGDEYTRLEEDRLLTESEVLQEEIITRIPGFIQLMMKYEWKPVSKILAAIALMAVIYYFVGWDAVVGGVVLYIFLAVVIYMIQMKNQLRDVTTFVEMKLPGQKITVGDHSPYSKEFYTTEKRFAVYQVPNRLIERGLFKIPGDQPPSLMPGSGQVIFVDFFDRLNRTCVLPRDMDVANIAFVTNANPMLAKKMTAIGEQIKLDKKMENLILDLYSTGKISAAEAQQALKPIEVRQKALLNPTNETRRDIIFELQSIIPDMREKIQFLANKTFLLADFLAAKGIYQSTNRVMPEAIREDHNFVYKVLGLPSIKEGKKILSPEE